MLYKIKPRRKYFKTLNKYKIQFMNFKLPIS